MKSAVALSRTDASSADKLEVMIIIQITDGKCSGQPRRSPFTSRASPSPLLLREDP